MHNTSEDGWYLPIHLRPAVQVEIELKLTQPQIVQKHKRQKKILKLSLQTGLNCNLDTGRDSTDYLLPSTGRTGFAIFDIRKNKLNLQAIRSPCGFLGFDFTLCCEDQNQPQITTQPPTTPRPTTQRPTTQRPTTQRPTTQRPTTQTTAAPQQDNCGTNSNNRIVGGTEARY